jgi:hypothetical protein
MPLFIYIRNYAILVMEQETSNEERKEQGEALSGGESSAEYIISKSEKESQLPENTRKISPTTDTKIQHRNQQM